MHLLKLRIEAGFSVNGIILVRIYNVLVGILRVVVVGYPLTSHIRLRLHTAHLLRVAIHIILHRWRHIRIIATMLRWGHVSVVRVTALHVPVRLLSVRGWWATSMLLRRHIGVLGRESLVSWRHIRVVLEALRRSLIVAIIASLSTTWVIIRLATLVGTRVLPVEVSTLLLVRVCRRCASVSTLWRIHTLLVRRILSLHLPSSWHRGSSLHIVLVELLRRHSWLLRTSVHTLRRIWTLLVGWELLRIGRWLVGLLLGRWRDWLLKLLLSSSSLGLVVIAPVLLWKLRGLWMARRVERRAAALQTSLGVAHVVLFASRLIFLVLVLLHLLLLRETLLLLLLLHLLHVSLLDWDLSDLGDIVLLCLFLLFVIVGFFLLVVIIVLVVIIIVEEIIDLLVDGGLQASLFFFLLLLLFVDLGVGEDLEVVLLEC